MPDSLNLAWLSGLFDGEGTARIQRKFDSKVTRRHIYYNAKVTIANTDLRIVNRVCDLLSELGIQFRIDEVNHRKNPHFTPCYEICAKRNSDKRKLLETVLPYLVGKEPQAKLVLRFLQERTDGCYRGGRSKTIDHVLATALYEQQTFRPKPMAVN